MENIYVFYVTDDDCLSTKELVEMKKGQFKGVMSLKSIIKMQSTLQILKG